MPAYKLMNFDTKGRAEVIRLAFVVAGQSFEDKRFPMEEWQTVKPTIPQKQLPCLQVDGRLIPQSGAIMRYVAREFGLYGDNNDENTRVDVIIGTAEDFLKSAIAIHYEKDETKKAELKKDLEENKLPQFFSLLEDILKENNDGDGFIVGLYGDNNDENTRVDVIIGTAEDFLKNAFALRYEKDETKRAELKKDLEENKLPQFFSLLEDILKENNGGDGFFVGEKISLADIMIYDITDQVGAAAKLPAFPPKLGGLIERVKNHPKIKEYLAKRGD
uniref:S-crystallin SL11 n=1 Tax=Magallana gigas TaxID=29159 RepID=K1R107_MAGGI